MGILGAGYGDRHDDGETDYEGTVMAGDSVRRMKARHHKRAVRHDASVMKKLGQIVKGMTREAGKRKLN